MPNLKRLVLYFFLLLFLNSAYAQSGFTHEIGVVAGPLQLKSDYGSRKDSKTNFGNIGFGVGIIHYINFSYRADCDCYTDDTYFNDHFKLRNEISWNKTKLEHFGEWVDPSRTSIEADQLRAHTGEANNIDIGTQIEFHPISIRSYQSFNYLFSPYISLGAHYSFLNPTVATTYGNGDETDSNNFYTAWESGSVDTSATSAWSIVSGIGTRYNLTMKSDILLDLRGQYYFSDWVDGLNHQLDDNKFNDWLISVNIGFIYYLD